MVNMMEKFGWKKSAGFMLTCKFTNKISKLSTKRETKKISVFVQSLIFFVYQAQIMLSIQVQFILFENEVPLKTEKNQICKDLSFQKKSSVLSNLYSTKIY